MHIQFLTYGTYCMYSVLVCFLQNVKLTQPLSTTSFRYTEAISEAVLNTGIHKIADERVKYSMAAHVERGGASFACCIWVYVAAIRDIRA